MGNQNHRMSIKQAKLIVNAHKHNLLKSFTVIIVAALVVYSYCRCCVKSFTVIVVASFHYLGEIWTLKPN